MLRANFLDLQYTVAWTIRPNEIGMHGKHFIILHVLSLTVNRLDFTYFFRQVKINAETKMQTGMYYFNKKLFSLLPIYADFLGIN